MTLYLDTSVLAVFFIGTDAFAARARTFFAGMDEIPVVSDFVAAEFASAIARLVRMNGLTENEARATFALFDDWRARSAEDAEAGPVDIGVATATIRRLDLNIRAPDAINLAVALRLSASVATFDRRTADNARVLGVAIAAT